MLIVYFSANSVQCPGVAERKLWYFQGIVNIYICIHLNWSLFKKNTYRGTINSSNVTNTHDNKLIMVKWLNGPAWYPDIGQHTCHRFFKQVLKWLLYKKMLFFHRLMVKMGGRRICWILNILNRSPLWDTNNFQGQFGRWLYMENAIAPLFNRPGIAGAVL